MKNSKRNNQEPSGNVSVPEFQIPVSRWGNWRTWLNLLFLFLALGTAVFSIEQAEWISPQPQFTFMLFLSIVTVWLLTVARLPGWALHLVSLAAGFLVILWQGALILPKGAGSMFPLLGSWLQGGAGLQAAEAKAIFGVLLITLTWLIGYLSAWSVLRWHNAWTAVMLGMVTLVANLSNLPGNTVVYFAVFLVASVLLVVQTNISRQQYLPGRKSGYSGKSLFYLGVSLLVIIVIAVSLAWVTPQVRLPALQNAIATGLPWKTGGQDSGFNILKAVPAKKAVSNSSELQDLNFGQYWNNSDDIKYTINSPQPAYWQVNVYDKYTSREWQSTFYDEKLLDQKNDWDSAAAEPGRTQLKYEVIPEIDTDVILLTGDFVSAEMPVIVRVSIDGKVTGARSPRVLTPGEGYTVRTWVADYSAAGLSAAGQDYPEYISREYLQLPAELPEMIGSFTDNLTSSAQTPYEKAMLIDTFLAGIPYSLSVKPLPEGADAVTDFLFTQQKGFCLHFASAMTVMLRTQGIPARLVTGYLPGDPGKEKNTYILRDKYYHAWTQIYFPGYGWIDFEPTPSGDTGSQVQLQNPVVSTAEIRQFSSWNQWYYPEELLQHQPAGDQPSSGGTSTYQSPTYGFSQGLGIAALIVIVLLAVLGLAYGIFRLIKPLYARQVWDVDRDRLAFSAYDNLCYLAAMNGIAPVSRQTPLEFAARIAEIIPEQTENLYRLMQSYLDKKFGPEKGKLGLYEEAELLKTRIIVFNAILAKRSRLQRYLWQK